MHPIQNSYSNEKILDYFLAAIHCTNKTQYQLRVQHFQFQWDTGKPITFEEVDQNFLNLDEKLAREKSENGKDSWLRGKSYVARKVNKRLPQSGREISKRNIPLRSNMDKATITAASTITCYKCGLTGHYANKCPNARQSQQNNYSKNNNKNKNHINIIILCFHRCITQ